MAQVMGELKVGSTADSPEGASSQHERTRKLEDTQGLGERWRRVTALAYASFADADKRVALGLQLIQQADRHVGWAALQPAPE